MVQLPESIQQYLGSWLIERYTFGFIRLDLSGIVKSWYGDLGKLGIAALQEGRPINEQLVFTEGLWPTMESSIYLPMVTVGNGRPLDVHLIREIDGYVLLLIDAYEKKHQLAHYQQEINELTLWKEKNATPGPPAEKTLGCVTLESFLTACNMAALLPGQNNKFTLIGEAPDWLYRFYPNIANQTCELSPENIFGFLENFLIEAHGFWSRKTIGCHKSGIWIEVDESGEEHLFEATAARTEEHNLLLISNENSLKSEKQFLIQKARKLALGHANLEKTQTKLQISHGELEARVRAGREDIEQAKEQLEEELVQRQQLEQERTQILLQLQQSQKMEAIGTLAGGIAHDFNNILSAVIGFTELSLFDVPKESPLSSHLHQVLSATQRAKDLIRQILTFSRQSIPETRPIRLNVIIKEALKLLRASLPATVEINQDLRSSAYIMADPTQLHQVVMNLCTNASHAMISEGGVIEIGLRDKVINADNATQYHGAAPGSYIEMTVIDNGSGMTKDTLGRIFDPFFTTKKKGQGTGMGLAVVHGIVKTCKGEISVASRVDKGTRFSIIFPTVSPIQAPEAIAPSDLPKGSERILFVDDEPAQADLALKTIPSLGYHVTAMTNSNDALKLFNDSPDSFDIVITDMYMPKITGKQLAIEILKIRPNMPIILSSGYSVDLVTPDSIDRYFKGHLMKPFLLKEMAETIRNVLDRK